MSYRDVTLVVTDRCNLRCAHCDSRAISEHFKASGDLTVEQLRKHIPQADGQVTISGGEPLILPVEFYDELFSILPRGVKTYLETNLLGVKKMEGGWLEILPNFSEIRTSFDTFRKREHGFSQRSFQRNIEKIRAVADRFSIFYTVSPEDGVGAVEQAYRMAFMLGFDAFRYQLLYPVNWKDPWVSPVKLERAKEHLNKLWELESASGLSIRSANGSPLANCPNCFNHETKKTILPGEIEVSGCLNRHMAGMEGTFTFPEECLSCEFVSLCKGGCPYMARLFKTRQDPYCEIYKYIFQKDPIAGCR